MKFESRNHTDIAKGSMIRYIMFNQNFSKKVTKLLKMMSVMF